MQPCFVFCEARRHDSENLAEMFKGLTPMMPFEGRGQGGSGRHRVRAAMRYAYSYDVHSSLAVSSECAPCYQSVLNDIHMQS